MNEVPLFDVPASTPVARSKTLSANAADGKSRWTRLRLKNRVPCDECIALLHEAGGVGPYARAARWRLNRNGRSLYLCHDHEQVWREDGEA
jgi:hypothetical protein